MQRLQADLLEHAKSGAWINFEVGVLRQVLRRNKLWAQMADEVKHLAERQEVGRQIPREHEVQLLDAVRVSGSPALLPLFVLSIDTGLRASEVRSLRRRDLSLDWRDGVIAAGSLTVPKSKTAAGTGRLVTFTQRACGVLTLWLSRFPEGTADSYVFPSHAVVMAPKGEVKIREVCLDEPMGAWTRSWYRALRVSGLRYRWHDLRHTYISRLAENPEASEQTIRSLTGHVSKRMLDRYSHIANRAKIAAVAALERDAVPLPEEGWVQKWAQ